MVISDFADLEKKQQIKDLLDPKTWNAAKELLDEASPVTSGD